MTLSGPVLVVGAGLLGTSVGLALQARGVEVLLSDLNEENLRTASGLGAGSSSPAPADLAARGRGGPARPPRARHRRRPAGHLRGRDRRRQRQGRAARRGARPGAGGGADALRRQPPDGRQRALRTLGRVVGALRRTAVGGGTARDVLRRRGGRGDGAGGGLRGDAVPVQPRGARRRRSPAPPTCRTSWPRSSPARSPRRRPRTWCCRARESATSPASPRATRACGSRSSPRTAPR